mgnify:CR=1 FL=1
MLILALSLGAVHCYSINTYNRYTKGAILDAENSSDQEDGGSRKERYKPDIHANVPHQHFSGRRLHDHDSTVVEGNHASASDPPQRSQDGSRPIFATNHGEDIDQKQQTSQPFGSNSIQERQAQQASYQVQPQGQPWGFQAVDQQQQSGSYQVHPGQGQSWGSQAVEQQQQQFTGSQPIQGQNQPWGSQAVPQNPQDGSYHVQQQSQPYGSNSIQEQRQRGGSQQVNPQSQPWGPPSVQQQQEQFSDSQSVNGQNPAFDSQPMQQQQQQQQQQKFSDSQPDSPQNQLFGSQQTQGQPQPFGGSHSVNAQNQAFGSHPVQQQQSFGGSQSVNDQGQPWGSQPVQQEQHFSGSQAIQGHGQPWGSQAIPQQKQQAGSMPVVQQNQYQFPNQTPAKKSSKPVYVLNGDPKTSSGKSFIYEAFPHDKQGNRTGDAVIVKLSENIEALEREHQNFGRIAKCENTRKLFVKVHDYLETANPKRKEMEGQAALIMERGEEDLRSFLRKSGPLKGHVLREAAKSCAEVVKAVHSSDMVWTEIKPANFVVKENLASEKAFTFDLKGIDLESAVPHKGKPIDYSPEACPPEFAIAFLCGREPFMEMDYSFDIWSLGMVFYKLATGTGYFNPEMEDRVQIANTLKNGKSINLDKVEDPLMKDLIGKCLNYDAQARPNIDEVLAHPFFNS